jgi:hypothetical protein
MKGTLVAVLTAAYICAPAAAVADTPGCVSHAEFDNMDRFLSTQQVAGRFDTNGWYIDSGPDRFRRGYATCWADDRKVVVWYSLNTGLSDDWAVRDY